MIGDIVGRPGRTFLRMKLPSLKKQYNIDYVIANGENAAGGNGITKKIFDELLISGVDFFTMGNHIWDNKDIFNFIHEETNMVRPANYPPETPGKGYAVVNIKNDLTIGILNLSGRTFMPSLDCPFRTADFIIEKLKKETDIIIVDFHAETTSEKMAMGYYLDGRATVVFGTHTHVQTADERILPKGTAYITDIGMTGPYDSILGVDKDRVIKKFLTQMPVRFEIAKGPSQINAIAVNIDEKTGYAKSIERINIKENYNF